MDTLEQQFTVRGITCGSCVAHVRQALEQVRCLFRAAGALLLREVFSTPDATEDDPVRDLDPVVRSLRIGSSAG